MSGMDVGDCEIDVASPCSAWRSACAEIEALARSAARLALADGIATKRMPVGTRFLIGIRLTDDAEQRRLNRAYRGKDASTNVLSFALDDPSKSAPPGLPMLLGDIVLAFETVRREAEEQRKPLADHLRHLVVHGVLHLLGLDHEGEEAAQMEAREVEILAAMGVPDPYRDIM